MFYFRDNASAPTATGIAGMRFESELLESVYKCQVLLCGAGISVSPPAGIPAVPVFLQQLARCLIEHTNEHALVTEALLPERHIRFEQIVGMLRYLDRDLRFLDYTRASIRGRRRHPNAFHHLAATFLQRGCDVLTTNFDALIELACATVSDAVPTRLHKLHGSIESVDGLAIRRSDARALGATLEKVSGGHGQYRLSAFQQQIRTLIDGRPLMIVGYSCSDSFDVVPALMTAKPTSVLYFDFAARQSPRFVHDVRSVRDAGAREVLDAWVQAGSALTIVSGDVQHVLAAPAWTGAAIDSSKQVYRLLRRTVRNRARAHLVTGMLAHAAGNFSGAHAMFTRALPHLRGSLRAQAIYRRANVMPEMDMIRRDALDKLDALRRSQGTEYLEDSIEVHIVLLDAESNLGPFHVVEKTWKRFESLLRTVLGSGFRQTIDYGKGLHGLALATVYEGRLRTGCRLFERSLRLRVHGGAEDECSARAGLCFAQLLAGALRSDSESWREFIALAGQLRSTVMTREINVLSAMLHLADGNSTAALDHALRANAVMVENGEQQIDPEIFCLLAIAHWNLGNGDRAKSFALAMRDHADRHGFRWQSRLALILLDRIAGHTRASSRNRYFAWFCRVMR